MICARRACWSRSSRSAIRFAANLSECLASYIASQKIFGVLYAQGIPLIVATLIAVRIIVIGCFYLVSPERILGTFGLKMPHLADPAAGFGIPLHNVSDYAFRTQRI
jgi:hypothetical protein